MPAVDDPFGIAASLPGQMKALRDQVKDLSVNRTFSPATFAVGAGGLTVLGATTLTGGIAGPVAATGALSGSTVAATGAITGSSVAVTGAASSATLTTSGSATIGGLLASDAGISSLDAKNRVLASGWSSLWVDTTGRFGQSPSARRFKQDITPVTLDVPGLLALTPVTYRLKTAVAQFGDAARVETGLIAEEVEKVAPWAIAYDADGTVQGINYDRLTVALLAIVKDIDSRLRKAGL